MGEIKERIEELRKLSREIEGFILLTLDYDDREKEEELIDNAVEAIDELYYFYEKYIDTRR